MMRSDVRVSVGSAVGASPPCAPVSVAPVGALPFGEHCAEAPRRGLVRGGSCEASPPCAPTSVIVRRATLADVENMHRLINHFASRGLMLSKSRSQLYQTVRDFSVAEVEPVSVSEDTETGTQFAGCGALHVIWADLGEIRSLAVEEVYQGQGVGRLIAEELLRDARALKLPRVFALTYQCAFFEGLGFVQVDKATMPQKVWGECMDCPKFPNCDEIAMVLDLSVERESPLDSVSNLDNLLNPSPTYSRTLIPRRPTVGPQSLADLQSDPNPESRIPNPGDA